MLRGEILANRQAIIALRLRGIDQAETEVDTILDTGFSEALALSGVLIDSLGWPRLETTQIMLADGTLQRVNVYAGIVQTRRMPTLAEIQTCESFRRVAN